MKGYVVTLLDLPQSVEVANRCIETAQHFNVEVEIFPAVSKDVSRLEALNDGIPMGNWWDTSYSNQEAVLGNIVSQHRIWTIIAASTEPGIVLEHDAVFVAGVPDLKGKGDIINLGKPSFNKLHGLDRKPGVHKLQHRYMFGAHGYYLTPTGAQRLLDKVIEIGAAPCDVFMRKDNFPDIKEYYPWPIEAHDTFTTIQKEKGCKSKHNFGNDYKIL